MDAELACLKLQLDAAVKKNIMLELIACGKLEHRLKQASEQLSIVLDQLSQEEQARAQLAEAESCRLAAHMMQHQQELEAERSVATALRRQVEEAQQDAAQRQDAELTAEKDKVVTLKQQRLDVQEVVKNIAQEHEQEAHSMRQQLREQAEAVHALKVELATSQQEQQQSAQAQDLTLKALRRQLSAAREGNAGLDVQLQQRETEWKAASLQAAEAHREENECLQRQVAEMLQSNSALRQEVEMKKNEVGAAQQGLAEAVSSHSIALKEAASGGQMSKLQKELEQLRTDAGQMKVHLQAATQSQMDAQAESSKLQQELQDLQSSTAKAEKQLQNEVSSLQGQLETALAECAKASQRQGQLETALTNSRNAHQQRETAFKARLAAEEREKRLAAELRQAQGALTTGEADRQALISQHAAALEQQGQRVEALEKQLQKLQGFERASRQEVEKLSRQLYLKKPQVAPISHKPYISYHSSERCYIPVFAGRRSSLYFLSFRSYGILWLGAVNYAASVASEILT
ncbi:TPA: hypothetical protein ACH3X3_010537 [Trebouxia sp. C0006]